MDYALWKPAVIGDVLSVRHHVQHHAPLQTLSDLQLMCCKWMKERKG